MSEAENKWGDLDIMLIESNNDLKVREAYKATLRREIEKLIDFETEGSEWDAAINTVLKLLDTVESSQDELWIELLRTTMTLRKKSKTDETDKYLFDIEEAKKRYRITRI